MVAGSGFKTIEFDGQRVVMLDQRLLPSEEVYRVYTTAGEVARAIAEMVIRGAPAIGIAAAYGASLAANHAAAQQSDRFDDDVSEALDTLAASRPTAVNLFWAVAQVRAALHGSAAQPVSERARLLEALARRIHGDDAALCGRMGAHGAALLPAEAAVITHCNTGALATGGIGTALGVIRVAVASGKKLKVYADETRPYLQGSRLTAWELQKDGIDVTLTVDSAAAWLMRSRRVDAVLVGADRIAANGDTANKIGTYSLALAAAAHGVPFYVVAPTTSIDLNTPDGEHIPIEERTPFEVTEVGGVTLAPGDVQVFNPAFDVTPSSLIAAIITEHGVIRAPYGPGLAALPGR